MQTQGGDAVTASPPAVIFRIIKRLGVNYSNYTTVATPQDIDQMIDGIRPFFLIRLINLIKCVQKETCKIFHSSNNNHIICGVLETVVAMVNMCGGFVCSGIMSEGNRIESKQSLIKPQTAI